MVIYFSGYHFRVVPGMLLGRSVREMVQSRKGVVTWLHGQAVKTSPFHGGNTGSIPVGVTCIQAYAKIINPERVCGPLAQLVRATGS